jgi:predicted methyltransferase
LKDKDMQTFDDNNFKTITLDCPFCYHGKVEIVERGYNIAKQIAMKTKSAKNCPVCEGKGFFLLTKH